MERCAEADLMSKMDRFVTWGRFSLSSDEDTEPLLLLLDVRQPDHSKSKKSTDPVSIS